MNEYYRPGEFVSRGSAVPAPAQNQDQIAICRKVFRELVTSTSHYPTGPFSTPLK